MKENDYYVNAGLLSKAASNPKTAYDVYHSENGRSLMERIQSADAAQATATLHGAEEGSGDIAISAWADVVSGSERQRNRQDIG